MTGRFSSRVGASLALAAALFAAPQASASHNADEHSPNLSLLANVAMPTTLGDIAFWKDRAAVSTGYDTEDPSREGFHLLDISRAAAPRLISSFYCPGAGYDVGIWENLVFLSVNAEVPVSCEAGDEDADGKTFAGIRIVSIADPEHPVQIATVRTCGESGSHTHTIVPDLSNERLLLYSSGGCVDIVEVPLRDPAAAEVIPVRSLSGRAQDTICHDITVLIERRLAGAACSIGDAQLWDISDPAQPSVLSRFVVPLAQNYHSTLFSADGQTLVVGDESLHGIATGLCHTGTLYPHGGLYFFDISDPRSPTFLSYFQATHPAAPRYCSAHQFNLVPRSDGRDVLAAAWYGAGAVLVDFTDPRTPRQIGHYVAQPDGGDRASANWSAYFYRGHLWATNMAFVPGGTELFSSGRGLDVLSVDDPAVRGALRLDHLNAQTQEPYPPPAASERATTGDRSRASPDLSVTVRPGRLRAGRRARLHVRVTLPTGDPARGALVRARGSKRRAGEGTAVLGVRPARTSRRLRVVASLPGYRRGLADVPVLLPRAARGRAR